MPIFSIDSAAETLNFKMDFAKLYAWLTDADTSYVVAGKAELCSAIVALLEHTTAELEHTTEEYPEAHRARELTALRGLEGCISAGLSNPTEDFFNFCEELYNRTGYSTEEEPFVSEFAAFQTAGSAEKLLKTGRLYLSSEEKAHNLLFLVRALKLAQVISLDKVDSMRELLIKVHRLGFVSVRESDLEERVFVHYPLLNWERLFLHLSLFFPLPVSPILVELFRLKASAFLIHPMGVCQYDVYEEMIPEARGIFCSSIQSLCDLSCALTEDFKGSSDPDTWLTTNRDKMRGLEVALYDSYSLLCEESGIDYLPLTLELGLTIASKLAPYSAELSGSLATGLLAYKSCFRVDDQIRGDHGASGAGAGVGSGVARVGISVQEFVEVMHAWVARVAESFRGYTATLAERERLSERLRVENQHQTNIAAARESIMGIAAAYHPDDVELEKNILSYLQAPELDEEAIDISLAKKIMPLFNEILDSISPVIEDWGRKTQRLLLLDAASDIERWEATQWLRLLPLISRLLVQQKDLATRATSIMNTEIKASVGEFFRNFLLLRRCERELELRTDCLRLPGVTDISDLAELLKSCGDFTTFLFDGSSSDARVYPETFAISSQFAEFFDGLLHTCSREINETDQQLCALIAEAPGYDFSLLEDFFHAIHLVDWASASPMLGKQAIAWLQAGFAECQRVFVAKEPIAQGSLIADWVRLREEQEEQRVAAAIKIQSNFKRYAAKKNYQWARSAAITLQSYIRGSLGRSHYGEMRQASVLIQSIVRMHLVREKYILALVVTRAQAIVRGHLARRRVANIRQGMRRVELGTEAIARAGLVQTALALAAQASAVIGGAAATGRAFSIGQDGDLPVPGQVGVGAAAGSGDSHSSVGGFFHADRARRLSPGDRWPAAHAPRGDRRLTGGEGSALGALDEEADHSGDATPVEVGEADSGSHASRSPSPHQ